MSKKTTQEENSNSTGSQSTGYFPPINPLPSYYAQTPIMPSKGTIGIMVSELKDLKNKVNSLTWEVDSLTDKVRRLEDQLQNKEERFKSRQNKSSDRLLGSLAERFELLAERLELLEAENLKQAKINRDLRAKNIKQAGIIKDLNERANRHDDMITGLVHNPNLNQENRRIWGEPPSRTNPQQASEDFIEEEFIEESTFHFSTVQGSKSTLLNQYSKVQEGTSIQYHKLRDQGHTTDPNPSFANLFNRDERNPFSKYGK